MPLNGSILVPLHQLKGTDKKASATEENKTNELISSQPLFNYRADPLFSAMAVIAMETVTVCHKHEFARVCLCMCVCAPV